MCTLRTETDRAENIKKFKRYESPLTDKPSPIPGMGWNFKVDRQGVVEHSRYNGMKQNMTIAECASACESKTWCSDFAPFNHEKSKVPHWCNADAPPKCDMFFVKDAESKDFVKQDVMTEKKFKTIGGQGATLLVLRLQKMI